MCDGPGVSWRRAYQRQTSLITVSQNANTLRNTQRTLGIPSESAAKGRTPGAYRYVAPTCFRVLRSLRVGWHWHWRCLSLALSLRSVHGHNHNRNASPSDELLLFLPQHRKNNPVEGARTTTRLRQVETSHIYNSRSLSLVDGSSGARLVCLFSSGKFLIGMKSKSRRTWVLSLACHLAACKNRSRWVEEASQLYDAAKCVALRYATYREQLQV